MIYIEFKHLIEKACKSTTQVNEATEKKMKRGTEHLIKEMSE